MQKFISLLFVLLLSCLPVMASGYSPAGGGQYQGSTVAPGASGQVLTSDGAGNWVSSPASSGSAAITSGNATTVVPGPVVPSSGILQAAPVFGSLSYGAETVYSTTGSSGLPGICAGPDGRVWVAYLNTNKIGAFTLAGVETLYSTTGTSNPNSICAGPDGRIWVAYSGSNKIAAFTTSGVETLYNTSSSPTPYSICAGPDGRLWVAYLTSNKVAAFTTAGVETIYNTTGGSNPDGICAGPDGRIWVAYTGTNKVAAFTTAGVETVYATTGSSGPYAICAGPDGRIWVAYYNSNKIAAFTTAGVETVYITSGSSNPKGICAGPDGRIWVTYNGTNKVAAFTTTGVETVYNTTGSSGPISLCTGPDGGMWVAYNSTHKIAAHSLTNNQSAISLSNPLNVVSSPFNAKGYLALSAYSSWNSDSGLVASPDGAYIYTTVQLASTHWAIIKIKIADGTVTECDMGAGTDPPDGLAISPDGLYVYGFVNTNTQSTNTKFFKVTTAAMTVATITLANGVIAAHQPFDLSPNGLTYAYVTGADAKLYLINTAALTVTNQTMNHTAGNLVAVCFYNGSNTNVYVAHASSGTVDKYVVGGAYVSSIVTGATAPAFFVMRSGAGTSFFIANSGGSGELVGIFSGTAVVQAVNGSPILLSCNVLDGSGVDVCYFGATAISGASDAYGIDSNNQKVFSVPALNSIAEGTGGSYYNTVSPDGTKLFSLAGSNSPTIYSIPTIPQLPPGAVNRVQVSDGKGNWTSAAVPAAGSNGDVQVNSSGVLGAISPTNPGELLTGAGGGGWVSAPPGAYKAGSGSGTYIPSGVLASSLQTNDISTPGNTNETGGHSYSVAANTLATDGNAIRMRSWGTTDANVDTKTLKVYWGGNVIFTAAAASVSKDWYLEVLIVRTSSNNQKVFITGDFGSLGALQSSTITTAAVTDSAGQTLQTSMTNGVSAVAGELTEKGFVVEAVP